jgi:ribulose-phosphate 3-epimerase
MSRVKIAPSILSADLLHLEEQIRAVEQNGAGYIHVDIMDGHFVPNITFGPVIVSTLKRLTTLPLDVHLMITNVDQYIPAFARAGADIITVHQEAGPHLHRSLQLIRDEGGLAGVSINPATSLMVLEPVFGQVDLILLMSVNPGFGGQTYIPAVTQKLRQLSELKKQGKHKFMIEVDGGINDDTVDEAVSAGAEILVAGNAIFGRKDPGAACRDMKARAEKTAGEA